MAHPSSEARKRGRKQKIHTAKSDFILADARKDYDQKLAQYRADDKEARKIAKTRGDSLPRGRKEPSRRAAEDTASERSSELGNMSGKRLLNSFAETARIKMCDDDYPENGEIDQLS